MRLHGNPNSFGSNQRAATVIEYGPISGMIVFARDDARVELGSQSDEPFNEVAEGFED